MAFQLKAGFRIAIPAIGLLILLTAGCDNDDRRGLEVILPAEEDLIWEYKVYEIDRDRENHVGTLKAINFEITTHEFRPEVLRQRRELHYDSLIHPTGPGPLLTSVYLDQGRDPYEILQYARDFYRIFDTALTGRVLDSLIVREPDNPVHLSLQDYEPGWLTLYRFDEGSNRNYDVHDPITLSLDFYLRDQHITGTVDIRTTGLFRRTERIDVPWKDEVLAHKVNIISFLDFDVMRDSTEVPAFRETIKMKNWFSPDGGLIKRVREPVGISVPGIPSRGPAIFDPGERWELFNLEGMDF